MDRCLKWLSSVCFYPLLFSGMLPEAVLPPSKEHSYAQWLERTYQLKNSRDPQTGKTDSSVTSQQTPSLKLLGMRYYNLFCSTLKTKLKALSCNRSVTFSSLKCLHDPPEITKTEDVRQCALCQQCGDSAPSVSFYVKAFGA